MNTRLAVGGLARRAACRPSGSWPARASLVSSASASDDDDGWLFGHLLDGAGGSTPLSPWDSDAVRRARHGAGAWVHLDFRSPSAQDFIASCARAQGRDHEMKRNIHVSSLMTADPRKTQPRCAVAPNSNGMLLTLQVNLGKRFRDIQFDQRRNIVPFRMWLGRGILITARGRQPDEGELRMPGLSQTLESGNGPATCGSLASAVIAEITSINLDEISELEDEIFALKARKQQQGISAWEHNSTMLPHTDLVYSQQLSRLPTLTSVSAATTRTHTHGSQ